MQHAEKTCDPCGALFTPGEWLTAEQADAAKSCSHFCSSQRAQGKSVSATVETSSIATLDAQGRCICSDCNRMRDEDRTALIARVAAEMGKPIAAGPRLPRTIEALERAAARARIKRLEFYDPIEMDEEEALS